MRQFNGAGIAMTSMAVVMMSQPAWAARTRMHELAESPYYKEKVGGMIGRGLLNAATCFVDPLTHTVNETKAGPPFVGTLRGIATGLGCGVLRLGSGAVDLVTFWVPGFNGFPVSDSYENCVAGSGGITAAPPPMIMPVATPSPSPAAWELPPEPEPEPVAQTRSVAPPENTWKK